MFRLITLSFFALSSIACAANSTSPEEKQPQQQEEKTTDEPVVSATTARATELAKDTFVAKEVEAKPLAKKAAATTAAPIKKAVKKVDAVEAKAENEIVVEQTVGEEQAVEQMEKMPAPNHAAFNAMLQKYVSNSGVVNYSAWKAEKAALDAYVQLLGKNEPKSDWSRSEKMAYWINLYNAATISLIMDNFPLKSIMDLDGGKVWDRKWIKVGTNTYSLNQIEHDILRPRFKDARIHFAVNCAAQSCPPIYNKAFTAANLNSSLTNLTRKFIRNTKFNQISASNLVLSNIFNWYQSDFGDLKTYVQKYVDTSIAADAKVSFNEYNWSLNGH